MIVSAPLHSAPSAREDRGGGAAPIDAAPVAFQDILQASQRSSAQTAIAFDKSSIFGVSLPKSSDGSHTSGPPAIAPIAQLTDNDLAASTPPGVGASQTFHAGASNASPTQHEQMTPGRVPLMDRKSPARAPRTTFTGSNPMLQNVSRTKCVVSLPRSSAVAPRPPSVKPQNLQPILVAVHETEQGLRVVARARALDGDELNELRGEAEALLARHGYRVIDLDIAASRKE